MARTDSALAWVTCATMLVALYGAFVFAQTEQVMGNIQRIFYVHLPLASVLIPNLTIDYLAGAIDELRAEAEQR